jgi:hypothetical protein
MRLNQGIARARRTNVHDSSSVDRRGFLAFYGKFWTLFPFAIGISFYLASCK